MPPKEVLKHVESRLLEEMAEELIVPADSPLTHSATK